MAKYGYRVVWPIDRQPWWERPHLAYLAAERLGHGAAFRRLVYSARFEQGRDISDATVIGDLAEAAGLDRGVLLAATDDSELRDKAADGLRGADRDGIFGVPFMAVGNDRFWGVDRLPDLRDTLSGQTALAG